MTKAKVSQQKRSRERAKQEKRQQKAERRSQSSSEKPKRLPGDEDPDLAGIVPGPQPSPWGEEEEADEEEKTE
jgi:hypothetical protein